MYQKCEKFKGNTVYIILIGLWCNLFLVTPQIGLGTALGETSTGLDFPGSDAVPNSTTMRFKFTNPQNNGLPIYGPGGMALPTSGVPTQDNNRGTIQRFSGEMMMGVAISAHSCGQVTAEPILIMGLTHIPKIRQTAIHTIGKFPWNSRISQTVRWCITAGTPKRSASGQTRTVTSTMSSIGTSRILIPVMWLPVPHHPIGVTSILLLQR